MIKKKKTEKEKNNKHICENYYTYWIVLNKVANIMAKV